MNWAKATTFIACEKTWREETRMMKNGSMECSKKHIKEGLGKFECKFYSFELIRTTKLRTRKGSDHESIWCFKCKYVKNF